MAYPTYKVQVGFIGDGTGLFTIGVSTLDSADTFGVPLPAEFDPDDDVTALATSMEWVRGRDTNMGAIEHGRGKIVLFDKAGKYNPHNIFSPLSGSLLPGRPVKIEAQFESIWYDLFNGWVRKVDPLVDVGEKEAVIEFVDYLFYLHKFFPVIPAMGPTTTGAVIEEILDLHGQDPTAREIDTGDSLADFTADGSKRATEIITELLTAEQGLFYIDRRGYAVYVDRHSLHASSVPEYTLDDEFSFVRGGADLDLIRNRARVLRTGGVEQEVINQESADLYGTIDFEPIESPYLPDDYAAASLAGHLVEHHGNGLPPVWNLAVSSIVSDNSLRVILQSTIASHLVVRDASTGIFATHHVERMAHAVNPEGKRHDVEYILSQLPEMDPFVIGESALDSADVFVY